jgi:hypothetical protein
LRAIRFPLNKKFRLGTKNYAVIHASASQLIHLGERQRGAQQLQVSE